MKYIKLFENHSDNELYEKYVINEIKIGLMNEKDSGWDRFIDEQEMGDCQSIVSSIIDFGIKGIEKQFGNIEISDACGASDEYDGKIFTHHWVTLNGKILEFSKGTLSEYVYWSDEYSVDDDGTIIYDVL